MDNLECVAKIAQIKGNLDKNTEIMSTRILILYTRSSLARGGTFVVIDLYSESSCDQCFSFGLVAT